jgi:hypothetical protein
MIEENEIKANELKDWTGRNPRNSSRAKLGFTVAGLGLGGVLAYLISQRARSGKRRQQPSRFQFPDNPVDDRGTKQDHAAAILRNLRDRGFDSSDEKVAVALGRTPEEIRAFSSGLEVIDDDVIMKARGIAMNRGIRVE